jgi:hypothetical protein
MLENSPTDTTQLPTGCRREPDDLTQSKLFIKTARTIEADEGKSASDELLGRLAKMPPKPHVKKGKES